ncbi:MAG TPA: hypothetical protein VF230_16245 [Acidimicrobiales bacterium]
MRMVERPPTWRGQPYVLTYLLLDREPSAGDLVALQRWATEAGMPNARAIPPSLLEWSSLFNPRFFDAVAAEHDDVAERRLELSAAAAMEPQRLARFWLESVLFLAGVTLSAAIVQSRHSPGTIASKYDRLWEAGSLATGDDVAPELAPLDLRAAVKALDEDAALATVDRLLAIRRLFLASLATLAPPGGHEADGTQVETMAARPLPEDLAGRFGFVDDLRRDCGDGLRAVIVYGSSVSSEDFADYDVLVVVDEPETLLRRIAGQSPTWRGKELNVGVYSPDELVAMQRLSGDNLAEYGVCVWGEALVVRKPAAPLLARNFSFGVVRQRQQLGMLSRAISEPVGDGPDDRRNLHEYFVKIPANVAKGTFGALGERRSKEDVHAWMRERIGFDAPAAQASVVAGDPVLPLATASLATGAVLRALNDQVGIVGPHRERHEESENP